MRPCMHMLGIGLLALISILTLLTVLSGPSRAAVTVDEDWVVDTVITDPSNTTGKEYIMRANLTITSTGQISFRLCKFIFMSTTPGRYGILVQPGGYLTATQSMFSAGELSPGVQAEPWTFYVKDTGRLSLSFCTLSGMGVIGAPPSRLGLSLETNDAYVTDCTLRDNNRGIVVMSGAAPTIADCTFEGCQVGLEARGSSFNLAVANTFTENAVGLLFLQNGGGFLGAGAFGDNIVGIRLVMSKATVAGVSIAGIGTGISVEGDSELLVHNSSIMTTGDRIKASIRSRATLVDCQTPGLMGFTSTDDSSTIRAKVTFRVLVRYAVAGYPVEDAEVKVYDKTGSKVLQQVTDSNGTTPWMQALTYLHERQSPPAVQGPFRIQAQEGYNNEELEDVILVPLDVITVEFVDDIPPELTVSSPAEGSTFNYTEVKLEGRLNDVNSGLSSFNYTVDGGPAQNLPLSPRWSLVVELPEGSLTIEFRAVDLVGNEALVTRHVTIDVTAPTILSIDPPQGNVTRAYSLLVTGRTEPDASITYEDNELDVDAGGNFSGYVSLGDEEGEQVLLFHLKDPAGNSETYRYVLVIDRTPPPLTVETDPDYRDFPFVNRSRVVVFGTTEPGAYVKVSIDATLVNETVADAQGAWRVEVDLKPGENDILVDTFDAAGNREEFEVVDFFLDTEPPEIIIKLPENGTIVKQREILVKCRTDAEATIWVNNEDPMTMPQFGDVELTVRLLFEGPNTLTVSARDQAGNLNTESVVVIYEPGGSGNGGSSGGIPVWAIVVAVVVAVAVLLVVLLLRRRALAG